VLLENPPRTPVARRLHASPGMTLGELFTYLSGLYFSGKLAYARAFATPPAVLGSSGVWILTFGDGLLEPSTIVNPEQLRRFAASADAPVSARTELRRSLAALRNALMDVPCDVVLLGSVQSPKYIEILEPCLGERLRFPRDLVRQGHLQRGAILLERAKSGGELDYMDLAELRALLGMRRSARPER
jgi:hypothetical protein